MDGVIRGAFLAVITSSLLMTAASAQEAEALPDAPSSITSGTFIAETTTKLPVANPTESNPIDRKFIGLAIISTGSTFADSFTTLFATQNWLAGKKNVCNVEVQSAYLYGTHPTAGRVYSVASAKSAVSIVTAYYLRKHRSRFWSAPLVVNSIISLQGVTQNLIACN